MAEPPSSPPSEGTSAEDALSWYKSQYEMLESELVEFRDSSRQLEQELEKDIERAEKQERSLQEKVEMLGFEVEEWKRKYKESKAEASAAQNALEKEVTTLRDSIRSLQLKLRDTEVANDDFERQARNTTSSLEDMESKYSQAIERAVIMEGEIRAGEQEREQLRIELQRLREELSDLKIEAELMQDKLKKQESRQIPAASEDMLAVGLPTLDRNADGSSNSTASSPMITTPPDSKSLSSTEIASDVHDPPSPFMSDASAKVPRVPGTAKTSASAPGLGRNSLLPSDDSSVTPKARASASSRATATRLPGSRISGAGLPLRNATNSSARARLDSHKIPASNSLSHIRSLTAQMQRLEARVQSARSKLPGPTTSPLHVSPRSAKNGPNAVPATVTIRSRKRTTTASVSSGGDDATPTNFRSSTSSRPSHVPRLTSSSINRLSFGPLPNRGPESDASRPSSQSSSTHFRTPSRNDAHSLARPMSRTSLSGTRTPLGRPRSSMSGSIHAQSASISRMEEELGEVAYRTPSRQGAYPKMEVESSLRGIPLTGSSIPTPTGRRQSGAMRSSIETTHRNSTARRTSTSINTRLSGWGGAR